MTFGSNFNLFLKKHAEYTNHQKVDKLKNYSIGDLLTLLRNIEECPMEYDKEIIKGVYDALFYKNIICI